MKRREVDALRELSSLRLARSAGRLAQVQVRIDDLKAKTDALRRFDDDAPLSVAEARVRDKWSIWRASEIVRLNGEIAQLEAQAQPLREASARDRARDAVLEKLGRDKR